MGRQAHRVENEPVAVLTTAGWRSRSSPSRVGLAAEGWGRTMERLTTGSRAALLDAWRRERVAARSARAADDAQLEWGHLERAHILSQPLAVSHVRTHISMLGYGVRQRDRHEIVGQLIRLAVAAPGSWTRKYPVGNTGGADVSALLPMAIPNDLKPLVPRHEGRGGASHEGDRRSAHRRASQPTRR